MLNKIKKGLNEYTDSVMLGGISFEQTINTDADLNVGYATAASIQFETYVNTFQIGDEIEYWCKQKADNSNYRKIGTFYIDTITRNKSSYKVTAYDAVALSDIIVDDWLATLSGSMTPAGILHSLCTYYNWGEIPYNGVNYNVSISNVKDKMSGQNVRGRSVLQWLAGFCGGTVTADSSGNLQIVHYSSTQKTLDNSTYVEVEFADFVTPVVEVVRAATSDDDIGTSYPSPYESGLQEMKIIGNPLFYVFEGDNLSTPVQNIYNYVHSITYRPFTVKTLEDFNIQAGDIITIDGISAYVMTKEMSGNGCTFTCTGNATRSVSLTYDQALSDLKGKSASFKVTLDGIEGRVTDAEGNISTLTQTAASLTSRITNAEGDVNSIEQTLNGVVFYDSQQGTTVIDGSHITTGQIDADYINGSGLNVSNATITYCDINHCNITDLDANRIEVQDTANPPSTIFLADADTHQVLINGGYIQNSTIAVNKLVADGMGVINFGNNGISVNDATIHGTLQLQEDSDIQYMYTPYGHTPYYTYLRNIISDIDSRLYALEHPGTRFFTISVQQKCNGTVGTYCTIMGDGSIAEGTSTTLQVTAVESGYVFDHWEYPLGTTVGSTISYITTPVTESRTYFAIFRQGVAPQTSLVLANQNLNGGDGEIYVTYIEDGITYTEQLIDGTYTFPQNTTLTFSQTADADSTFYGWYDPEFGHWQLTNTLTMVLTSNTTLNYRFIGPSPVTRHTVYISTDNTVYVDNVVPSNRMVNDGGTLTFEISAGSIGTEEYRIVKESGTCTISPPPSGDWYIDGDTVTISNIHSDVSITVQDSQC